MELEYYLLCKKRYIVIIKNLEEIVDNFDLLSKKCKFDINQVRSHKNAMNFFIKKIQYAREELSGYEELINSLCKHEFVDDLIDIPPDRTEKITYCRFCDFTK
jgi:hypothetical protein